MKKERGPASMVFVLLVLLLGSCSQRHFPAEYLVVPGTILEGYREEWAKQNRPADFSLAGIARPAGVYFSFTNSVNVGGRDYKCLFGARRHNWPPGVLAITEDGVILWVRDSDGQVTLSPDVNGIDL